MKRCVVVGASLAGLRAVEGLRRGGFGGEIVVFGEESHMPYNRPPLSKGAPTADAAEELAFRIVKSAEDVDWRLGSAIVRADLQRQTVETLDGEELAWDGLVCATGLRPRRLAHESSVSRRHVLRTVEDAQALFAAIREHGSLTIIGGGFVGCEMAASGRSLGASVDVVVAENVPMLRTLGAAVGAALRTRHEQQGVRFHLGRTVVSTVDRGPHSYLELDNGSELPADLVLEAIGAYPRVDWLEGNDIDLTDGVLANEYLRVDGFENVVGCGDVVRWPNLAFDSEPRRVEHWTTSAESGRAAGISLAATLTNAAAIPFTPVPTFWSDQYDTRVQSFGMPGLADTPPELVEGEWNSGFAAAYYRAGLLIGVVLVDLPMRINYYRSVMSERLSYVPVAQVGVDP